MITLPAVVVIAGVSTICENFLYKRNKELANTSPTVAAAAMGHALSLLSFKGFVAVALLPLAFDVVRLNTDNYTPPHRNAIALSNLLRLSARIVTVASVTLATLALTPSVPMVLSGLLAVYLAGQFLCDLNGTMNRGLTYDRYPRISD